LIVNRDAPPFDNADLRRAMALSLDRKAFIDILTEGQGNVGGVLQAPPAGSWGMPKDVLETLPGYNPDVQKNRTEARGIMQKLGYGPDKRLKVKVSSRGIPPYRDPAVILIDQLKEVYIDGELETIDTTNWFPRSCARTIRSASTLRPTSSTIPIPPSMRTMFAVPRPTLTDIATPK
jgi:peptide/nickel transport system substrate-binding protein